MLIGLVLAASAQAASPHPPAVPDGALGGAIEDSGAFQVEARLLVEHDEIAFGTPFRVGVLLDLMPGWHIYWHEPGAGGLPTQVEWRIDEAEIGPLEWPEPERFNESPLPGEVLDTWGYSGQVLLSSEITVNSHFDGPVDLAARVRFVACGVGCIPGEIDLHRTLVLGAPITPDVTSQRVAELFEQHARRLAASESTRTLALWQAFLLALAGGLILNLMPCVLPVLAIKTFALAELAQARRSKVVIMGAAYTAGILCSMLALAFTVLALRGAGLAVGWGFQFQEPIFLTAISMLVLVFAMNLLGLWEVRADVSRLAAFEAQAHDIRRSFFDGFLAVALATPCSAPFLGTAVGFAFAGGAIDIVVVFVAIGLGLALPFALVSLVPGWSRWIPRAGPWMLHVRAGLGLALLATLAWLLWILGRTGGAQIQFAVAVLLGLTAVLTWRFGRLQRVGRQSAARATAFGILALFGVGVIGLSLSPVDSRATGAAGSGDGQVDESAEGGIRWLEFDRAAIGASLREQRPVFVSFTADWCITCKVNERLVLQDERVVSELARLRFASYRADWTQQDESIRAELARHGKAGVPVYLIYSPARPGGPVILPEVLTVDGLLEALAEAAEGVAERV